MNFDETIKLVDALRERGAVQVRVGELEVIFAGPRETLDKPVDIAELINDPTVDQQSVIKALNKKAEQELFHSAE